MLVVALDFSQTLPSSLLRGVMGVGVDVHMMVCSMGLIPNISDGYMAKRPALARRYLINVLCTFDERSDPIFTNLVILSSS